MEQAWSTLITEPGVHVRGELHKWIHDAKSILPEGSSVSASVREHSFKSYQVKFQTSHRGRQLVSLAQGEDLESVIAQAGRNLYRRLINLRRKRMAMRRKMRQDANLYLREAA